MMQPDVDILEAQYLAVSCLLSILQGTSFLSLLQETIHYRFKRKKRGMLTFKSSANSWYLKPMSSVYRSMMLLNFNKDSVIENTRVCKSNYLAFC